MLTSKRTMLICGVVIVALAAAQGFAATLRVDPNDPTAFQTIQKAIDAAKTLDTVVVQPGIYKENIDFKGKAIVVTSTDPNDPEVVAGTIVHGASGNASTVTFRYGETERSILDGLTVRNGVNGVTCQSPAQPTIKRCVITQNTFNGIGGGKPAIVDCMITRNRYGVYNTYGSLVGCVVGGNQEYGVWIESGQLNVINCTIVGNANSGVYAVNNEVRISNSIVAYNGGRGLSGSYSSTPWSQYTNVYGNLQGNYNYLPAGKHDISEPPYFADNGAWDADGWHQGDYHLLSTAGRWDPTAKAWVKDPIDSPCIDKGDPNTPVGDEPYPNGGRINLGAYGGTAEASMSLGGLHCVEYPEMDFNHDCKVDQADLDLFMQHWLECGLDDPNACWPQGPPAAPNVQP